MFDFYEIVRIISSRVSNKNIGKEGYISGKVFENDDHENGDVLAYGVFIFDIEEVTRFYVDEMVSLGKFIDSETLYSGERIRVKNDNGKGVIVDEDD